MTNWVESYFERNPEAAKLPVVSRSRFSLHLRRAGRHRLALITGAPMHYYASAGREWRPIDTRLRPRDDGRYGAPGLPFILGLDGSVAFEGNRYRHRTWRIGLWEESLIPSLRGGEPSVRRRSNPQNDFLELHRLPTAHLHDDRLVRDAGTLRHEIILLPGGLREELTLFEPPRLDAQPGAVFVTESLLPAGGFPAGLVDEGLHNQMRFPQGWAQDAAGQRIPMLHWVDRSGRRLYSGVPVDWLANATYPVVLDPDIDITGSTADGYIEGDSVSTSSAFDSSGASINVGGQNVAGAPRLWRGYLKFNTSSLGAGTIVERVNLQLYPTALSDYVAWTIYVRQYDWSANDPMATGTREAAWDGLLAAANTAVLATSADPANTPVTSQDLPTNWVQVEGNTYYGLWCDQEGYSYPTDQGGQHQYSSANHTTPSQRPLLLVEYVGRYPLTGPVTLRAAFPAARVSLPDTRIILRSRARRTALNAIINGRE